MAPPSSVDLGINYAEYLELILMRRGVVSFDELEQISARFDALDLDHDGTLSQTDIDISNLFDLYDFNHDGLIDLASFAQLCVDIIVVTENHRFARQVKALSIPSLSRVSLSFSSVQCPQCKCMCRSCFLRRPRCLAAT